MAHALIFGASGISGWSLLNQTRVYPSATSFARITGTTNRPLSLEQAQLPRDDRVQLVHGVDLTKSVDQVVRSLKDKIADVHTVTHVFFTAYIEKEGFQALKEINTRLLDTAVRAIDAVAPGLQSFILQTGGKGYGLEFPKEVSIRPPLTESSPRIPEPWASDIFYYSQYDRLAELSRGKSWTFTEIRPDGIIGFTPVTNPMNLAQGIALYLEIYKEVHGAGARIPFPGQQHGYQSTHTDTFQDLLSRMEIHAALNPDKCGGGGIFNVADGKAVTWQQVWPRLCEHFGLVGTGPDPSSSTPLLEFVDKHKHVWKTIAQRHGLKETLAEEQHWGFIEFMLVQFNFDRHYNLQRSREVGFTEEIDTVEGYKIAWERMRKAKMLP
ncbi:hypothetical protein PFICI_11100 [Pestalotiopsis fici W106-1]|uniref:PRISE-like Rossmann-fold domain-containing protein n=1 Tax=Pestalotiopsis fici (strain W106-1 / CGMCC3.15140) TaxID=1229662 RepID=W3WWJ5_PESFW|nr:uncharacterized protein PFICI_11100 [Pestalotiopsis fici W106-1]ETS77226.1 hypothetical protein PFICI_11100 [Pestalotiopsis fici W106-1]